MVSKVFKNPNNGKLYQFSIEYDNKKGWHDFTIINVTDNVRRVLRVRDSSEYTIKINKSSVSANGGARGLFCFIADAVKNHFMDSWAAVLVREFPV